MGKATGTTKAATNGNGNGALKVPMTYKKSTPGTHVFASDDPDAAVTQLYVRKSSMEAASGKKIVITVS